jgi:hypothetical protein
MRSARPIREFRIQMYLPFLPDKVMKALHCWECQQSSISPFLLVIHSRTQKHVDLTLRFDSECLLSIPRARHLNGLLTMPKKHHIVDTQPCKSIMSLSDHQWKKIIRDTVQECFLQDFRTIYIVLHSARLFVASTGTAQLLFVASTGKPQRIFVASTCKPQRLLVASTGTAQLLFVATTDTAQRLFVATTDTAQRLHTHTHTHSHTNTNTHTHTHTFYSAVQFFHRHHHCLGNPCGNKTTRL